MAEDTGQVVCFIGTPARVALAVRAYLVGGSGAASVLGEVLTTSEATNAKLGRSVAEAVAHFYIGDISPFCGEEGIQTPELWLETPLCPWGSSRPETMPAGEPCLGASGGTAITEGVAAMVELTTVCAVGDAVTDGDAATEKLTTECSVGNADHGGAAASVDSDLGESELEDMCEPAAEAAVGPSTSLPELIRDRGLPIDRIAMVTGLAGTAALAACAKAILNVQWSSPGWQPHDGTCGASGQCGGPQQMNGKENAAKASADADDEGITTPARIPHELRAGETMLGEVDDGAKAPVGGGDGGNPAIPAGRGGMAPTPRGGKLQSRGKRLSSRASMGVCEVQGVTERTALERLLGLLDRQIAAVEGLLRVPSPGCEIVDRALLSVCKCKVWTLQSLHGTLVERRAMFSSRCGYKHCDVMHALADEQIVNLLEDLGQAMATILPGSEGS